MTLGFKQLAPVGATVALLVGLRLLGYQEIARAGAPEAFARAKAAIDAIPTQVGPWHGERRPLDAGAMDLLRPNAEANVAYQNQATGRWAQLLVVQTRDARDLCGHAPVVCYPSAGFAITRIESRTFRLGDQVLTPAIYHMTMDTPAGRRQQVAYSVFVFPDGTTGQTLADVNRAAADYGKLAYGAAHVQVLTADEAMGDAERDQVFKTLVGSDECLAMIRTLRTGIPHK